MRGRTGVPIIDGMSTPTEPAGQPRVVAGEYRIGDVEREQASRQIIAAVGSGHLTVAEADQRMADVYEARWPSDLLALLGDLPPAGQQPPPPPPPPVQHAYPAPPQHRNRVPLFPVLLLAFGVSVFFGPVLHEWILPLFPLVLGGLLLVRWQLNNNQQSDA